MTINESDFTYSKNDNKFEYRLLKKHGGIKKNDKFILISKNDLNEVLKLEDYLIRDSYREIAKDWAIENCKYNNSYELTLLTNGLLSDRKKLKKVITKNNRNLNNLNKKLGLYELIKQDSNQTCNFYQENWKKISYKYSEGISQIYKIYRIKK